MKLVPNALMMMTQRRDLGGAQCRPVQTPDLLSGVRRGLRVTEVAQAAQSRVGGFPRGFNSANRKLCPEDLFI